MAVWQILVVPAHFHNGEEGLPFGDTRFHVHPAGSGLLFLPAETFKRALQLVKIVPDFFAFIDIVKSKHGWNLSVGVKDR
jgi:hypothetical protein